MLHFIKFKNLFLVLSVLLIFPSLTTLKHEEYYSLTNIQYKESEKTLQITMRLFTEEVEFALKKQYSKNLELGNEKEIIEANELLINYLKLKFNVSVDGKLMDYQWVGKEFEKDQMIVYLEIKNVEKFKILEVKNATLIDVFSAQENIVKVKAFDINKTLLFNKKNDSGTLIF